jgi:peptide deformylase
MKILAPTDPDWYLLWEVCAAVKEIDGILPDIEPMKALMRAPDHARGIGLAAPQVGIPLRFFIYGLRPEHLTVVINPSIIQADKYKDGIEGCLSFPGRTRSVERAERITVRYTDVNGNQIEREMRGLNARIFQHETDHLDGKNIFGIKPKR